MQVVVIKDMSAGNDTVGDMWKETKICSGETTLLEVMQWAGTKKQVTVTVPDGQIIPLADDPIL